MTCIQVVRFFIFKVATYLSLYSIYLSVISSNKTVEDGGLLRNVIHKIASGELWSLLNQLQSAINGMNIVKRLAVRISAKYVKQFGY